MPTRHMDPNSDPLSELEADALSQAPIELELLLRYAREPAALSDAELQEVESYLEASPAHRDRLRVMARLAAAQESGALAAAADAPEAEPERGVVVPIGLARRRAVRLALAAGLAGVLIGYGVFSGLGGVEGPRPQLAERGAVEPPPPNGGAAPVEIARQGPPEAAPPPETDSGDAGAVRAPESLAALPEAPPEPSPPDVAPAPDAPPAPGPAVVAEAPREAGPPAERRPLAETTPPETWIVASLGPEPLAYAAPGGALEPARIGGALRSVEGATPGIAALVPDHVGRTVEETPTLYWYLSAASDSGVGFALSDLEAMETRLELELEGPHAPGVHGVALRDHDVRLSLGRRYQWVVSLAGAGGQILSGGVIERYAPSAELGAGLARAGAAERIRLLAANGVWFDALDGLSRSIERHPDRGELRLRRAELLEAVGLEAPAQADRRAAGAR